jgi:colanic acid/amylovoran biosynthesis protein
MQILIVNLHSSRNAGDDVLTRVTVGQLAAAFPEAQIVLSMNDPESYGGAEKTVGSFMTWFRDERGKWRWVWPLLWVLTFLLACGYRLCGARVLHVVPGRYRVLMRAWFSADLVISSAGNFLYSSGRFGLVLILALYTMLYGRLLGKPVYMMPQTVGPLRYRHEELLVRWTLARMQRVVVRDALSRQELLRIGAWQEPQCLLVPDLAFAMQAAPSGVGRALLQQYGSGELPRPWLGVCLINWGAQNRSFTGQEGYEAGVADTIRHFVQTTGGSVFLLAQVRGPSVAEDDLVPARRVHQAVAPLHDRVVLVEQEPTPEQLKAIYGLMDIFMGSRLHATLFAVTEHVPTLVIQYQYKSRGVMQMLGLEQWVIEIERADSRNLIGLLMRLWSEREAVRQVLDTRLPPVVAAANGVAETVVRSENRPIVPSHRE